MATHHRFAVYIVREDRDEEIYAGAASFEGQDYDGFDGPEAREALRADGRLKLGPDFVEFGDVIAPVDKVDRVVVTLAAKGK